MKKRKGGCFYETRGYTGPTKYFMLYLHTAYWVLLFLQYVDVHIIFYS